MEQSQISSVQGGLSIACGGRFDRLNLTWPFVQVTITESGVTIRRIGATFELAFSEIDRMELMHGLFSRGIALHHRKSTEFSPVILWTRNVDLRAAIERGLGQPRRG